MSGKTFYPIFLDIDGRRAVVVGGGKVGFRKARGLVDAGARVTVISPRFLTEFDGIEVERVEREFTDGDLDGAFLAFAATDRREVNQAVARRARALGILSNVADAPEEGAFIVPARMAAEGVQIAISTSGANPARAAMIRSRLEQCLASTTGGPPHR